MSTRNIRNSSFGTTSQMIQIPQSEEDAIHQEDEFIDDPTNNHNHQSPPPSPLRNRSHADQLHMRKKIRRWKQITNNISISLLMVSCTIIALYFTTHLFDDYKTQPQSSGSGGLTEFEHEILSDSCRAAKTNMDSYDSCVDGCLSHLCCFEGTSEEEDSVDSNNTNNESCAGEKECVDYDMCAELQAIFTEQTDWPLEINAACDVDVLMEHRGERCQEMCENAKCCFELGEESCYQGREAFCDMYGSCEELYKGADMFGIGVGPVIIPKSNP